MIAALSVLALLGPGIAAAPAYVLDVGARTELRLRAPGDAGAGDGGGDVAWDAEISAHAQVSALFRRARLGLGYTPRFTLLNFSDNPDRALLHEVNASAEWRWRRVRLSLDERASYGDRTFLALATATPDPVLGNVPIQATPEATSVRFASTDTELGSQLQLSLRSRFAMSVGYTLSGALDRASRAVVPRASGPHARVAWDYSASRRDNLLTAAEAAAVRTSGGADSTRTETRIGRIYERWSRQWARRTQGDLTAGAAAFEFSPSDDERVHVNPTGGASLTQTLVGPKHGFLTLSAALSTDVVVDRLTGLANQRVEGTLSAGWASGPFKALISFTRAQSLFPSEPNAVKLTSGQADLRYRFLPPLAFECGVRVLDQKYESPTTTTVEAVSGLQRVAYVALVFQADPVHF